MATTAEAAGADWIGLADAFWWRDVWMQLVAVAGTTATIEIGPAMTNPYLRHPFHTASALATLQELAPGRVFCGIAAGGSELSGAAGISRTDAPERVVELTALLASVARGEALDAGSGRRLDVPLAPLPTLVAGRGDRMLRAAGAAADRVLLWCVPESDLERSAALVRAGAAERSDGPESSIETRRNGLDRAWLRYASSRIWSSPLPTRPPSPGASVRSAPVRSPCPATTRPRWPTMSAGRGSSSGCSAAADSGVRRRTRSRLVDDD